MSNYKLQIEFHDWRNRILASKRVRRIKEFRSRIKCIETMPNHIVIDCKLARRDASCWFSKLLSFSRRKTFSIGNQLSSWLHSSVGLSWRDIELELWKVSLSETSDFTWVHSLASLHPPRTHATSEQIQSHFSLTQSSSAESGNLSRAIFMAALCTHHWVITWNYSRESH